VPVDVVYLFSVIMALAFIVLRPLWFKH